MSDDADAVKPLDLGVGSWTVYRVPPSHYHAHLWNFEWAAVKPARLQEQVLVFLHGVEQGKAPHLLLTGAPGIGKSHIGVGAYRVAAAVWGTGLVTWLNVPAFCEAVKRGYGGAVDPWVEYEEARRLVVLDDLFGKELTGHEKDQIVTRLLDTAYMNNAAVLVTMNQSHTELPVRLPAHEVSRLLASATIIPVSAGKDWRRG
jgi:DNA replication protein DnaC